MCILIKCGLKLNAMAVMLPAEYKNLEIVAIDIDNKTSTPLRIACVYRPPDYRNDDSVLFFSASSYLADNSLVGD